MRAFFRLVCECVKSVRCRRRHANAKRMRVRPSRALAELACLNADRRPRPLTIPVDAWYILLAATNGNGALLLGPCLNMILQLLWSILGVRESRQRQWWCPCPGRTVRHPARWQARRTISLSRLSSSSSSWLATHARQLPTLPDRVLCRCLRVLLLFCRVF